jgi:hypothetical protein
MAYGNVIVQTESSPTRRDTENSVTNRIREITLPYAMPDRQGPVVTAGLGA